VFSLPSLGEGQPLFETRQVLEDLAESLDGILQTKDVAPPGASDLAALQARLNALEADQLAEDNLRAVQPVTFSTGWAQFTGLPYGELVRCWKSDPTTVRVVGLASYTGTGLALSATANAMFTLPVGYRPAVQSLRMGWYQAGSNNVQPFRLHLLTTGVVAAVPTPAIATSQWIQLDFSFRTVNT
jgi:hypothetical protein